ncbi:MAG: hypothetical protein ACQES0_09625 [Bacteroidota bacterium]
MKKILLIIAISVAACHLSVAQYKLDDDDDKPSLQERLRFGGGLGLSFGNITMVDISPRVSYMIHPRWFAGLGGNYLYYKNNYYQFSTNMYGFSAFSNFALIKDFSDILPLGAGGGSLLIHAEANLINMDPEMDWTSQRDERFWLMQPMAGLGLKIPAGIRSYALILFMYNFNEKVYSPTNNPVISVSLMF